MSESLFKLSPIPPTHSSGTPQWADHRRKYNWRDDLNRLSFAYKKLAICIGVDISILFVEVN